MKHPRGAAARRPSPAEAGRAALREGATGRDSRTAVSPTQAPKTIVLLLWPANGRKPKGALLRWWQGRLPCEVRGLAIGPGSPLPSDGLDGVKVAVMVFPCPHKATNRLGGVPVIAGWRKSVALPIVRQILKGATGRQ